MIFVVPCLHAHFDFAICDFCVLLFVIWYMFGVCLLLFSVRQCNNVPQDVHVQFKGMKSMHDTRTPCVFLPQRLSLNGKNTPFSNWQRSDSALSPGTRLAQPWGPDTLTAKPVPSLGHPTCINLHGPLGYSCNQNPLYHSRWIRKTKVTRTTTVEKREQKISRELWQSLR